MCMCMCICAYVCVNICKHPEGYLSSLSGRLPAEQTGPWHLLKAAQSWRHITVLKEAALSHSPLKSTTCVTGIWRERADLKLSWIFFPLDTSGRRQEAHCAQSHRLSLFPSTFLTFLTWRKLSYPNNGLFMCRIDKVLVYTFCWVTLAQNSPVSVEDSEQGKWQANFQPIYILVSSQ